MRHFETDSQARKHAYRWARDMWNDTVGEAFVNYLAGLDEDEQDRVYRNGYSTIRNEFESAMATVMEANGFSTCAHNWVEQEGEPPRDVCNSCGAVRE